ncbi:DUF4240 domain-containing protein [Streptomyces alfalfae]
MGLTMDSDRFWHLVGQARVLAADPADAEKVAIHATTTFADHQPAEILQAERILWDLTAASYLAPLSAAAYQITAGCSDYGFDYFRGWLIAQGHATSEQGRTAWPTLPPSNRLPQRAGTSREKPGRIR